MIFARVACEIPHCGIDLSQRNLHYSSVKAGGVAAKSQLVSIATTRVDNAKTLHSVKIAYKSPREP